MPTRDELEFENKRQQIMQGALHVFSHKGFEKATNKDIAEASKIGSPGLIYHYFKDKQDLFYEMLNHFAPAFYMVVLIEKQLMEQPPDVVLGRFAQTAMRMWSNPTTTALLKVILGEALRNETVAKTIGELGPGKAFSFFHRYFQRQMDLGVMRPMNPSAAVRCFLGPLIGYVLAREVLRLPDSADLDPETMARTLVDVFLQGMLVQSPQPAG
jgi:TetR/AcrR family transcriptional regulator, mexJK operon transcriptional repressor